MRSGCLSLLVRVGAVSAAAILAALSVALILSFGVSTLGQPEGLERIFKVIVAAAAGFAFFLVGRGIWRDLRRRSPADSEEGSAEERGRQATGIRERERDIRKRDA